MAIFTASLYAQFDQSYQGQTHTTPSQAPAMQLYGGFVTGDATNYPASHGSLFGYSSLNNGYGYSYQIFKGHTSPHLNIRFAISAAGNTWFPWKKILDSGNDLVYEGTNADSKIMGFTHIYGRASDGSLHLRGGNATGQVFINHVESGNVILANGGGKIGIGTAAPSDPVTLEKNNDYASIRLRRTGASPADFRIMSGYNQIELRNSAQEIKFVLKENGNVGIGTTNPGNYRLAVEGKIGAREVVVTTTAWADYVFEPTYDLRPLSEVEAFIKENKHLPEIPSAKEVEANGVSLGEMNVLLLKKVEELTLYLIELKKENETQRKQNEIQQKEIDLLKREKK